MYSIQSFIERISNLLSPVLLFLCGAIFYNLVETCLENWSKIWGNYPQNCIKERMKNNYLKLSKETKKDNKIKKVSYKFRR